MKNNEKYNEKVLTNKRADDIIKSIQRKSKINKKRLPDEKGNLENSISYIP